MHVKTNLQEDAKVFRINVFQKWFQSDFYALNIVWMYNIY